MDVGGGEYFEFEKMTPEQAEAVRKAREERLPIKIAAGDGIEDLQTRGDAQQVVQFWTDVENTDDGDQVQDIPVVQGVYLSDEAPSPFSPRTTPTNKGRKGCKFWA